MHLEKRVIRSSLVAAGVGALAAAGLVVFGISATSGGPKLQAFAVLLALLCPPWEIFWAGIGEPHNIRLWALLSVAVVAANALLYMPAGLVHAATAHRRAWIRLSAVTVVALGSLALGHLCFIP